MGCLFAKCKPWNDGPAESEDYHGHNVYRLDFEGMGMSVYGVYHRVPCLQLMYTWFSAESYPERRTLMGMIEWDDYGVRVATLRERMEGLASPSIVWRRTYGPEYSASEPLNDLYRQHAMRMPERF